jgi:predicted PurR-regulated permease PerM
VASSISVITLGDFGQVPLILVTFTLIRLLDDSIVQPLTISQSVKLHPLTIIFTILIGGQLFGILGMLFAVPIAGVVKVVASELYFGLKRYRAMY